MSQSLPRARGDRPSLSTASISALKSAPRPRGSALSCSVRTPSCMVCPAPAGIGRYSAPIASPEVSLPRARGDRPPFGDSCLRQCGSAPRPRGSAFDLLAFVLLRSVCPAPAGIGRHWAKSSSMRFGLPRARGDRPQLSRYENGKVLSAPRPRGSALNKWTSPRGRRVCPAPAGIGRQQIRSHRTERRLPRARGDRPSWRLPRA